jgi:hypothetical protein
MVEPRSGSDHRHGIPQRAALHVPVGYRQEGDRVTINVGWPERKRWWRDLRHGGRVEMRIRGHRRSGQAQSHGDERAGVTVEVQLDPDVSR